MLDQKSQGYIRQTQKDVQFKPKSYMIPFNLKILVDQKIPFI